MRYPASLDLDGLSGSRVDTLASLAVLDAECAEAHQAHFLSLFEPLVNDADHALLCSLALHLRQARFIGDCLDQLCLVHSSLLYY